MDKHIPYYPPLIVPTNRSTIINPVLTFYSLIKHTRQYWVYNRNIEGVIRIQNTRYSMPIFIPEAGCLTSLDTVSSNLHEDFKEMQLSFDGFKSKNKIMTSKLFNHDQDKNRVVTKGSYYFHNVEEIYNLYINNLENEISLCPSIVNYKTTFSPTRWFKIISDDVYRLKFTLNYNYSLLHITRDDLLTFKTEQLYLDKLYDVYKIECGLIKIQKDGHTWRDKSIIYFTENPFEILEHVGEKGEYFICYSISLNDYNTNNSKCNISTSFVNIVNSISPLVYSLYDVCKFIVPYFIDMDSLDKCVYKIIIPDDVINKILGRFYKFSSNQNEGFIKGFESWKDKTNVLTRHEKIDNNNYVYIINPGIISYIIKKYVDGNEEDKKISKELLLKNDELFYRFFEFDEKDDLNISYFLKKYNSLSHFRLLNFRDYLNIFKHYCE